METETTLLTETEAQTTDAPTQEQGAETTQQSTETQTPEVQEETPQGAPESYDFKFEEGREFDQDVIAEYSEVAKELNLTQENAQKILDKVAPKLAEKQQARVQQMQKEWSEAATNDKEFGGEKLSENLAVAKKALDQFGSPELNALLVESGLGNHPEIIRAFYRAGKAISEDSFVGPGQNAGEAKPRPTDFRGIAEQIYGNKN